MPRLPVLRPWLGKANDETRTGLSDAALSHSAFSCLRRGNKREIGQPGPRQKGAKCVGARCARDRCHGLLSAARARARHRHSARGRRGSAQSSLSRGSRRDGGGASGCQRWENSACGNGESPVSRLCARAGPKWGRLPSQRGLHSPQGSWAPVLPPGPCFGRRMPSGVLDGLQLSCCFLLELLWLRILETCCVRPLLPL